MGRNTHIEICRNGEEVMVVKVRKFAGGNGRQRNNIIKQEISMKKILSTGLVSLLLGAALPTMAQTQTQDPSQPQSQTQDPSQPPSQSQTESQMSQSGKPTVKVTEAGKMKATVQDVDPEKKTVTLKGQDGNIVHLTLPNARNLSQLKKGDVVTADFYQSTAVALAKPGETPTGRQEEEFLAVPEKGQMPGGTAVRTIKETATIEKINAKKREVTLRGAEGNTVKLKVDPRVTNLDQFKKGDQIAVTYTEAVAISVAKGQGGQG
jgi:hypothetical protein